MKIPLAAISPKFALLQNDLINCKNREERELVLKELRKPEWKYAWMENEVKRQIWIIRPEETTSVRWAPWPWIPKEKLNSLPRDALVYLNWYWFQTAWFLQQHSVDYRNGTLLIINVSTFKKTVEEL